MKFFPSLVYAVLVDYLPLLVAEVDVLSDPNALAVDVERSR